MTSQKSPVCPVGRREKNSKRESDPVKSMEKRTETDSKQEKKETILHYVHTEISYHGSTVVYDINLSVREGEILCVVGESGSGKSTLLKATAGLLSNDGMVTRGDIFYRDINIPDADPAVLRKLRGPEIGMIFQDAGASFSPLRKYKKQLYEIVRAHREMPKEEIRAEALELFASMKIPDGNRLLESYPFELSGGMNQRVGIVAAMMLKPALLLADEPTSALDVRTQAQVIRELLDFREKYGTAIVMVTHNIRAAEQMADNIAVMYQGKLVEYSAARQVTENPQHSYTGKLLQAVPHLRIT